MDKIARKFTDYFLLAGTFVAGVLFGIFVIYTISTQGEPTPEDSDGKNEETENSEEKVDESTDATPEREVSAYLVWWDQERGFETLQDNADVIDTVHPFWYQMKADGTVEPFSGAADEEIVNFCKRNNIKILPVISNEHDPLPVSLMLEDSEVTQAHINNIVALVQENNYDGIEIDYESLNEDDREGLSQFITDLSTTLHENDLLLTSAVHAKKTDEGTWSGPAAQDWATFNTACDSVKIMTYDYHWSTSEAGDIAPLSWMRDVLDYAVSIIDKEKIHLGIHFYGYDWVGEEGQDLTYNDVQELIELFGPVDIQLSEEMERTFTYSRDETEHTVYFSDKLVVEPRIELVTEYDIGGIGIWRIGQEDTENWSVIESEFSISQQ